MSSLPVLPSRQIAGLWRFGLLLFLLLASAVRGRAAIQFDVFVGYDGLVREASWFPISCEVYNDGPGFTGIFEISSSNFGSDQSRTMVLELPTNTRKRFFIPLFYGAGRINAQWDARLLDQQGKLRAERSGLSCKPVAWEGILLGAIPKSFSSVPSLPEIKPTRQELKPQVARIQLEQFPDNPIALEGMSALYLNSEKALGLKINQVTALLAWVRTGGHLILAIEQNNDITATPWLQQFLPVDLTGAANMSLEGWDQWFREDYSEQGQFNNASRQSEANPFPSLVTQGSMEKKETLVATGTLRDGRVIIGSTGTPLVVQANRGLGRLTVMMFSPEREPFRSWKDRNYFWARLLHIPAAWFTISDFSAYGGRSMDGVFGSLIESRQVKKLPVEWLLLLLAVYLIVIGPFDQWWLKKINRQMLTWITFPSYVILFSLLIYFIGYKLRAGDTEWGELSIVDVLPRGEKADLRGRTYTSIYSSGNARYQVASEEEFAAFRPELIDLYGAGQNSSKANIQHVGNSYKAEVYVPVWTSLLFSTDWMRTSSIPLMASVARNGKDLELTVQNFLNRPLNSVKLMFSNQIFEVGSLEAGQKKTLTVSFGQGQSTPLGNFVMAQNSPFSSAVESRKNPLGNNQGRLDDGPAVTLAASFFSMLETSGRGEARSFVGPAGLDLTPVLNRGDAVLVAWDEGNAPVNPFYRFTPKVIRKNTLFRLAIPVKPKAATL